MKIKHLFVSILLATGFQPMIAQSALRQQFVNSSVQEARPWTFWYWMFGAVTPEGITADLEAMHRVGLGGAYLMPIKGVEQGPQYEGKAQQLTPEWWRMVTHSMKEADRLGMQLGMHICDGFALAGGPWMTPEDWVNPMRGYAYDSFNKDALLRLAKAENGRMVLPGGASYKVLVLPTARPMNPDNLPLSPEAQAKVEELRAAGVIIPQLPYREDDFSSFGVERDVLLPADVAYTHRSGEEYEIYFVANQVDSLRTFNASFRIAGRTPELWNAVTGTITRPAQWKEADGRTEVALSLPANGSVFVVFPKESSEVSPERIEREPVSISIKEWTVTFPSVRKTVTRPVLFDWSKEEDEKIKYYSGHATYRGLFRWKNEQDGRIILRLGKVANVATVRVNSIACGTAWTAPYEVDITDALRNGTNVLEVEVVNTWANALRGADQDKAPFEGIWTNAKFRLPGDGLLPAGWMGPCEFFRTKE